MTTVNQSKKFYLPFTLPKYGTATQQNQYFVQSAGAYLAPMRSYAYGVVEKLGGIIVSSHTRHHNVEFKVAHGQHFIQIMKAMGINITHMTEVNGGFKCYKDGDMSHSVCFIQKKTVRGTSCVGYTAVLAMRHVAHELFLGVFPPNAENSAPKDTFIQEALGAVSQSQAHADAVALFQTAAPTPEEVKYTTPITSEELEAIERRSEQQFLQEIHAELEAERMTMPEPEVTSNELPLGL